MRLVIQRVKKAAVTVNEKVVGSIGRGLVILVGVTHDDTEEQVRWLARKVAGLRTRPARSRENVLKTVSMVA